MEMAFPGVLTDGRYRIRRRGTDKLTQQVDVVVALFAPTANTFSTALA